MELKVVNALSRDVEREHLNRILKYLSERITQIDGGGITEEQVKRWISESATTTGKVISFSSGTQQPVLKPVTVVISGDATGSGTGTSVVEIPVTLTGNYLSDAPSDGLPYWRQDGQWMNVPFPLLSLAFLGESGIGIYDIDTLEWVTRSIEGDNQWITVTDGNGVAGNPNVSTTEAAREGYRRIQGVATESIHGGRAVVFEDGNVRHPDLGDISDSVKIAGIAMNAGGIGDLINVQTGGTFREPSWNWLSSPVFVEDQGVLTQTAPTTGYVISIGRSIDSTTIDIDVSLPLLRN